MDGEIKTADEESTLQIEGYGSVFIKHMVLINNEEHEVTTFNLYIMLLAWLTAL